MGIQIKYTDDNGKKVTFAPVARQCWDGSHPICTSSDSELAECVCWCAECKEIMAQITKGRI